MRYLLGVIRKFWIPPAKFDVIKDEKNNFLWVYWFFCKRHSSFVPPVDLHWIFEIFSVTWNFFHSEILSLRISKFHFSSNLSFGFWKVRQLATIFFSKYISFELERSFTSIVILAQIFISIFPAKVHTFGT